MSLVVSTKIEESPPKKLIEFPKKTDTSNKQQNPITGTLSNPKLYNLLEQEFNPHNIAGSPPNAFISVLKQRMDCYY